MLSHPIAYSMSLALPDKVHLPNVILAAGTVLLKPALDSLLISGFPDSSVTLGGRIVTYSKGLTLLEPMPVAAVKGYDIMVPTTSTKPILPSIPLLQFSSMTAASGVTVMFGMTACFLFLVAAGTFLVRSHAGSEPASGPSSRSLSETLAYNREQRQAQNGRAAARRRGGRGRASEFSILFVSADKIHFDVFAAPDPIPPNNNQNDIPTEDIKPPEPSKSLLTNHFSIFVTDCFLR
jgi:hypothetical protein